MSKRARVLVIDDDPLFRSLLVSFLRQDYFVSVASEGSEGFYKALEHPPEIAIIDIQMPGWDGLKTLGAFRGHNALADVKIVIITSDASEDTITACIRGGADSYVNKTNFSKEELYRKLDRLVPHRAGETGASEQSEPDSLPQTDTPASVPPVPKVASGIDSSVPTDRVPLETAPAIDSLGVEDSNARDDDHPALQDLIDDWE